MTSMYDMTQSEYEQREIDLSLAIERAQRRLWAEAYRGRSARQIKHAEDALLQAEDGYKRFMSGEEE